MNSSHPGFRNMLNVFMFIVTLFFLSVAANAQTTTPKPYGAPDRLVTMNTVVEALCGPHDQLVEFLFRKHGVIKGNQEMVRDSGQSAEFYFPIDRSTLHIVFHNPADGYACAMAHGRHHLYGKEVVPSKQTQ